MVGEQDGTYKIESLDMEVERRSVLSRRRDVPRRKDTRRAKTRARASRGELPHFTVGDFVPVAGVRKLGAQGEAGESLNETVARGVGWPGIQA